MQKILRLFKKSRSKLLPILALVALFFFVIISAKPQSTATITPQGNKFKLDFNIQKPDEKNLAAILEKLNLYQSTKQGIEFELDATASAKLDFAAPIKAKIVPADGTLNFQGTLKRSQNELLAFDNIDVPSSSTVAILTKDFKSLIFQTLNPSPELAGWIDQNLKSDRAQILVIFGTNNDFAVVFKNKNIDLATLKNIKSEKGEPIAKEEMDGGVSFILLKLSEEKILAIFQKGEWNYFVSSAQGAKDFAQALKSPNKTVRFPNLPPKENLSMVINFTSRPDSNIPAYLFTPAKSPGIIDKIANLKFVLAGSSFFGSFSVK